MSVFRDFIQGQIGCLARIPIKGPFFLSVSASPAFSDHPETPLSLQAFPSVTSYYLECLLDVDVFGII